MMTVIVITQVLLKYESQRKMTNVPKFSSLVIYAEKLRPGHWLASMLWVFFSASTLLVR